jgi:hypothetical protein
MERITGTTPADPFNDAQIDLLRVEGSYDGKQLAVRKGYRRAGFEFGFTEFDVIVLSKDDARWLAAALLAETENIEREA